MNNISKLIQTENIIYHIKEFFDSKRKNGVISLYSAASIYGLADFQFNKIDLTFPTGSIPKGIYDQKEIKFNALQRKAQLYSEGIKEINFEGINIKIYDIERTLVEVLKEYAQDNNNIKALEIFKKGLEKYSVNKQKVKAYAKLFKVELLANALLDIYYLEETSVVKISNEVSKKFRDNIYYLMRFESKLITFPMVQTIIDHGTLPMDFKYEVEVTNDLIKAWKMNFSSMDKLSLEYLKKLNKVITSHQALKPGELRTSQAYISGTTYLPPLPNEVEVIKKLKTVLLIEDKLESALEWICYGIKSQMFWDGNKRTSILFANKILYQNNLGLITIHEDNLFEFNNLLSSYYDDESAKEALKTFLWEKCFNK